MALRKYNKKWEQTSFQQQKQNCHFLCEWVQAELDRVTICSKVIEDEALKGPCFTKSVLTAAVQSPFESFTFAYP